MDSVQYRKLQEEHIANLNGTTRFETVEQVVPIALSTLLSSVAISLLVSHTREQKLNNFLHFTIEFFILVFPVTLTLTLLNDYLGSVIICLLLLILLVVYAKARNCCFKDYRNYVKLLWCTEINERNKYFITTFRASANLVTALCIFAVDFGIFPRKLAKTEYFGYSVMDLGVGLFCISNAVICPEVRYPASQLRNSARYVFKTVMSCLPLIVLGFARFFTLKNVDYHIHVTEYGIHWNFFVTLAVIKILSSVIMYFSSIKYVGYLSILVAFSHQCILSAGVQDWVLDHHTTRSNFLAANREGIVSLAGYLAIYFAGIYIGNIVRNMGTFFSAYVYLSLKFAVGVVIFWQSTILAEHLFGVSRRLANSGYVIWVVCVSLIFLEMLLLCLLAAHSIKVLLCGKNKPEEITYVPILYDAVNFNGLACFLLSNVLTGLVNMCLYTLTFSKFTSTIIILLYMYIVCSGMVILYHKKVKLKCW